MFKNKFFDIDNELRFLFIGRTFWRKGGAAICKVLEKYRKYYPIKLTIVSDFINPYEYEGMQFQQEEIKKVGKWIGQNHDWVECYKNIPNKKVLSLAKESHIGLLPSYQETYGYAILEFQAAGCPVVSTDVRAMLEINSEEYGWVCKINKDLQKINYSDAMNEEILKKDYKKVFIHFGKLVCRANWNCFSFLVKGD